MNKIDATINYFNHWWDEWVKRQEEQQEQLRVKEDDENDGKML